jgi:hypothetical protein
LLAAVVLSTHAQGQHNENQSPNPTGCFLIHVLGLKSEVLTALNFTPAPRWSAWS